MYREQYGEYAYWYLGVKGKFIYRINCINWLIDWLADWPIKWLINQSAKWLVTWKYLRGFLSIQTCWKICCRKDGGLCCTTCCVLSLVWKNNRKTCHCDRKQTKNTNGELLSMTPIFYLKSTQTLFNSATILLDITFSHIFSLVYSRKLSIFYFITLYV